MSRDYANRKPRASKPRKSRAPQRKKTPAHSFPYLPVFVVLALVFGFGYFLWSINGSSETQVTEPVQQPKKKTVQAEAAVPKTEPKKVAKPDPNALPPMPQEEWTYLEELEKFRPDILISCQEAMAKVEKDLDFIRPEREAFLQCADESIDYAVMEKTEDAVVVPLDAGWSDVGSYAALWEVCPKDSQHNVIKGDVIAHDTSNSYLHSQNKLIATLGVDNLVVIDTPDAVLVANKDQVQNVKDIVNELKTQQRSETKLHREVYRPWGKYDSVDHGERFQVKRITVNPGAKLSVQMHHHRAEHWIVVSGTAKVTLDEKTILLSENQSTYIPIGVVHALENPGKLPLEMIEVQSGSYLGEDDIVRFEDKYGRVK